MTRSPGLASQENGHVLIPSLEQHFPFKVKQAMLARPQQESDDLVADGDVDLEDVPERDEPSVSRLASVRLDDGTQLLDLLVHVQVRLDAARLRQRSLCRSTVPAASWVSLSVCQPSS